MGKIRVAVAGVGNCASLLIQGVEYYRNKEGAEIPGLLHPQLGKYGISDIEFVAAFDVDTRKVGQDLSKAVFAEPNNTVKIADVPKTGVTVEKGPVLDGIGENLAPIVKVDAKQKPVDIAKAVQVAKADILVSYMPVGSYNATRFYAEEALKAGVGFINCIPEFIASDPVWAKKFEEKKLPIIGDDIKGQMGASIFSRTIARLFKDRGAILDRMYQLNFGGNTDFINLLEDSRLKYKRISKTETVQSVLEDKRLGEGNIRIGPSDYVAWLKSRKIAHMRFEGRSFGDIPLYIDVRLDVEDKSESSGVVIDAIRCEKLALDRKTGGALVSPSAYFMKMPPVQYPDYVAKQMLEEFISGERER